MVSIDRARTGSRLREKAARLVTLHGDGIMIRTAFKNRFRDHRGSEVRGQRPDRRAAMPRRESVSRRDYSTVVHPWMSLPERLAATQAAMRELAGGAAFQCPLGEMLAQPEPVSSEAKPRSTGVNVIIRKRRLPATSIPSLVSAS